MHAAVSEFVKECVEKHGPFEAVVEFGARNINGEVRNIFFESAKYVGIDIADGPGVDEVGDASSWGSSGEYSCVVCCEVFEHTPKWQQIVGNAFRILKPGGWLIVTAAGENRTPHSALDEQPIRLGEFYANIGAEVLGDALNILFTDVEIRSARDRMDIQATARKA